jgi:hypothetical protein
MVCPFCAKENASNALVCHSCSRDIAVPVSLIAERDDLIRKRNTVREDLVRAKRELETHKPSRRLRPI